MLYQCKVELRQRPKGDSIPDVSCKGVWPAVYSFRGHVRDGAQEGIALHPSADVRIRASIMRKVFDFVNEAL